MGKLIIRSIRKKYEVMRKTKMLFSRSLTTNRKDIDEVGKEFECQKCGISFRQLNNFKCHQNYYCKNLLQIEKNSTEPKTQQKTRVIFKKDKVAVNFPPKKCVTRTFSKPRKSKKVKQTNVVIKSTSPPIPINLDGDNNHNLVTFLSSYPELLLKNYYDYYKTMFEKVLTNTVANNSMMMISSVPYIMSPWFPFTNRFPSKINNDTPKLNEKDNLEQVHNTTNNDILHSQDLNEITYKNANFNNLVMEQQEHICDGCGLSFKFAPNLSAHKEFYCKYPEGYALKTSNLNLNPNLQAQLPYQRRKTTKKLNNSNKSIVKNKELKGNSADLIASNAKKIQHYKVDKSFENTSELLKPLISPDTAKESGKSNNTNNNETTYCNICDIKFLKLSSYQAHKIYYCPKHTIKITT